MKFVNAEFALSVLINALFVFRMSVVREYVRAVIAEMVLTDMLATETSVPVRIWISPNCADRLATDKLHVVVVRPWMELKLTKVVEIKLADTYSALMADIVAVDAVIPDVVIVAADNDPARMVPIDRVLMVADDAFSAAAVSNTDTDALVAIAVPVVSVVTVSAVPD